ncbi:MAG: glycine cleavage system protein GcvH [Anaerolineae bacterium]|nr:glycine cleavage system protein GcvH [Anaerolineae bacterium]
MGSWKTPENRKYLKTDEWLLLEGDTATIGISDYAQDQLNDIVFVEQPSVGTVFAAGDVIGVVESVKAASDIVTPVAGTVIEVNQVLEGKPETINSDPYDKGWIVKLKVSDASGADGMMDAAAYSAYNDGR